MGLRPDGLRSRPPLALRAARHFGLRYEQRAWHTHSASYSYDTDLQYVQHPLPRYACVQCASPLVYYACIFACFARPSPLLRARHLRLKFCAKHAARIPSLAFRARYAARSMLLYFIFCAHSAIAVPALKFRRRDAE